jgi:hypothetical protein
MKTLVVYYYNEDTITINNLAFFLKHGVIDNDIYKYVFIINKSVCSIDLFETDNITIVRNTTDTIDLVAYSNFCIQQPFSYFTDFKRFYFISSVCIGPFLPSFISDLWIELLNKRLEICDLLAPIVEFPPDTIGYSSLGIDSPLNMPFLHSYMFGTNSSSIKLLLNIFKNFTTPSIENSINYERVLSTKFILNNKKISCLLLAFKNIDINDKDIWNYKLWNRNEKTCYEVSESYFGIDLNPLEIMFIKNIPTDNRVYLSNVSRHLRSQLMNYTVWY